MLPDGPERTALYRRMAALVDEDGPWIPVEQPLAFDLRHGWLENYKRHDFPCGMIKYWRVDAAKRNAAATR